MSSERIVIIEDNPVDSRILDLFLSRRGYDVIEVHRSGLEGLNACLLAPPKAVLLDLVLPQLRGEEVCRLLRATDRTCKVPILIVSEVSEAMQKENELLGMGADAYLSKPFSEEALDEALKRAIAAHHQTTGDLVDTRAATRDITAPRTVSNSDPASDAALYSGYRLMEVLGAGGMGTVYRAVQVSLDRLVALKVLKDYHMQDARIAQRFDREARIMARINHPSIVQVFDFGRTKYHYYISMELVEGGSLLAWQKEGRLGWPVIRNLVNEICEALAHLHDRKIFHRDIKPSNILMTEQGHAKLADFGITAAELPEDRVSGFEEERFVVGTRFFIAPEMRSQNSGTHAADQFALGMTLWQLLTGKAPRETPPPLIEVVPQMPKGLSDVIDRALDPDPNHRYPSMLHFRDAFLQSLS
jgi:CheY-like chemotaxis protein/tRNA A-37 threonylcarbamoyl transferase component Bud32